MYKWDQALYMDKLVSYDALAEAFTPAKLNDSSQAVVALREGREMAYGFGWAIDDHPGTGRVLTHTGGWLGFRSIMSRYPDEKMTIIMLSNRMEFDVYQYESRISSIF